MDAFIQSISEMTIGELCKYAALLFGGITCYIEFSKKIKWNPLSAILKWFGERLLVPVNTKIEELKETQASQEKILNELRDKQDDNEIDRIRWEILNFARSCRNGEWHATDEFEHMFELNTKYHGLLGRRKLKNGRIDLEYNYIVRTYESQHTHGNS